jgi:hypothetical protein
MEKGLKKNVNGNKSIFQVVDNSNPEWTLVQNITSGKSGFVPSNYIGE